MHFQSKATPLTQTGLDSVIQALGVEPAALWAVLAVETSGCGFLKDRRPRILFERHLFHQRTGAKFPVDDINNPEPGGHVGGGMEYGRLERAIALDRNAALESTSWGLGQILGSNHKAAGFPSAESMVQAMCESEDAQLAAMAKFLKAPKFRNALRTYHWSAFARAYNGPTYSRVQYDTQLAQYYAKYSEGPLPDLATRTAQLQLLYLGGKTPVDGIPGPRVEAALSGFQKLHALPPTGKADAATLSALSAACNPVC